MPCRYDPTDEEIARDRAEADNKLKIKFRREFEKEFEHNSTVAELLCSLMKALDTKTHIVSGTTLIPDDVAKWWKEHQQRDESKAILDQIREKKAKQDALDKLTNYEKKILGLTK